MKLFIFTKNHNISSGSLVEELEERNVEPGGHRDSITKTRESTKLEPWGLPEAQPKPKSIHGLG